MIILDDVIPEKELPYEPLSYSTGDDVPLYWPTVYNIPECFSSKPIDD